MSSNESSFEETLTWAEANELRGVITDYARRLRGEALLAEAEGAQHRRGRAAAYERAAQLESKVLALFYRLSESRSDASPGQGA